MHRDACCRISETMLLGIVVQIEARCINLGCIMKSDHGSQKESKPDAAYCSPAVSSTALELNATAIDMMPSSL